MSERQMESHAYREGYVLAVQRSGRVVMVVRCLETVEQCEGPLRQ